MDIEKIKSVFTLFTGQNDYEKYLPIIKTSVSWVESMLKDSAYSSDPRLDMLAAAAANYRYVQILSARMESISAYNGKMLVQDSNSGALKYARQLLKEYMEICSPLIGEQTVFISTGGSDD